MIITSLRLQDFGKFYGSQTLSLGPGVYIFHGRNGLGKTTLLNAVRWALYGHFKDRQGRVVPAEVMLNRSAARESATQFAVELLLTDNEDRYLIRRTQLVTTPLPSPDFYVERNGQPLNAADKVRAVQRLLNEDVSRFFLFDGEQLQQYEALLLHGDTQSQVIKQSIEQILGLPVLDQTLDDLAAVRSELSRKFARQAQADSRTQQHALRAQQLQQEIEAKRRELGELDDLANSERQIITEKDAFLQQYETSMLQVQQLDRLDDELRNLKERRREILVLRSGGIDHLWQDVLVTVVAEARVDLENQQKARETAIVQDAKRALILSSLRADTCQLCQSSLTHAGRAELEVLAAMHNHEAPQEADGALLPILRTIVPNGQIEAVLRSDRVLAELESKVVTVGQEAGRLRAALQALPTDQVSLAANERDRAMIEVGRLNETYRISQTSLEGLEAGLRRAEQSIRTTGTATEAHIAPALDNTDALIKVFDRAKAGYRDELRTVIERDASEIFSELTTEPAYARLRINDSYGLEIVDAQDHVVTGRSAGQEQVVALALVAALSRNASRRAPVIMDTPFGRLDPGHREKVLRFSARMAEQVFFLVHGGEVSDADLSVLAGQVSAEYQLEYQDANCTQLVERSSL